MLRISYSSSYPEDGIRLNAVKGAQSGYGYAGLLGDFTQRIPCADRPVTDLVQFLPIGKVFRRQKKYLILYGVGIKVYHIVGIDGISQIPQFEMEMIARRASGAAPHSYRIPGPEGIVDLGHEFAQMRIEGSQAVGMPDYYVITVAPAVPAGHAHYPVEGAFDGIPPIDFDIDAVVHPPFPESEIGSYISGGGRMETAYVYFYRILHVRKGNVIRIDGRGTPYFIFFRRIGKIGELYIVENNGNGTWLILEYRFYAGDLLLVKLCRRASAQIRPDRSRSVFCENAFSRLPCGSGA